MIRMNDSVFKLFGSRRYRAEGIFMGKGPDPNDHEDHKSSLCLFHLDLTQFENSVKCRPIFSSKYLLSLSAMLQSDLKKNIK